MAPFDADFGFWIDDGENLLPDNIRGAAYRTPNLGTFLTRQHPMGANHGRWPSIGGSNDVT
jgi:hypothetical protein